MDWRPIETAPKDGTPIIGYWINTQPWITREGRSDFDCIQVIWWHGGWWQGEDRDDNGMEPTHWQPLPAPPPR